jgi:hypothetical protein
VVQEFMGGRGARMRQDRTSEQFIWMGDFNWHHPLWDEEQNAHLFTRAALEATQLLLDLVNRYDMRMVLPKDLPTLEA